MPQNCRSVVLDRLEKPTEEVLAYYTLHREKKLRSPVIRFRVLCLILLPASGKRFRVLPQAGGHELVLLLTLPDFPLEGKILGKKFYFCLIGLIY